MRVIDYFDKGVEIAPDRAAVVAGDLEYTYQQVQTVTHEIASGMWASGFDLGQRVAIYSNNDAQAFLCMLGLWRAGGIWVPANVRNALQSNIDYFNDVGVQWLFYHSEFQGDAEQLRGSVPTLKHLFCLDRDAPEQPALERLIERGRGFTVPDWGDPFGNPEQIMALWPTGGTTGRSKAVMMNNLSWGTTTEIATRHWYCDDLPPVCLMVAPITHAAGGIAVMMANLGATNVILRGFDAL